MSRIYKNRSRYRKNSPDKERCVILGEYIIETGGTVREAAARFGISKSTVHTVVTKQNGPRGRKLKPPKRINKGFARSCAVLIFALQRILNTVLPNLIFADDMIYLSQRIGAVNKIFISKRDGALCKFTAAASAIAVRQGVLNENFCLIVAPQMKRNRSLTL